MLKKLEDNLRSLGRAGGWAANVIQFLLSAYPGFTLSALVAGAAAYFDVVIEWVQEPSVYVPAGVFLFSLWTYIGLATIRYRQDPQLVRIAHDYAYGLILDGGWRPVFGKFPAAHPTNPGGPVIMINCDYRNVSQGPLKLRTEEFRVILNNRTNDDPESTVELTFARLAAMGLRSGGVPINRDDKILAGNLVLRFLYGHPDFEFSREYTLKLNLQIVLDGAATDDFIKLLSVSDHNIAVKDEPYP